MSESHESQVRSRILLSWNKQHSTTTVREVHQLFTKKYSGNKDSSRKRKTNRKMKRKIEKNGIRDNGEVLCCVFGVITLYTNIGKKFHYHSVISTDRLLGRYSPRAHTTVSYHDRRSYRNQLHRGVSITLCVCARAVL